MFKHLKRWTHPANYAGKQWPEYYVFLAKARGANTLDESNFDVGLAALGGESDTVIVAREGHWAVGHIYVIYIHESNLEALKQADELLEALDRYPVLDENDWSQRETDAIDSFWQSLRISERIGYCSDAGESIFAARFDYPSPKVFDWLRDTLQP